MSRKESATMLYDLMTKIQPLDTAAMEQCQIRLDNLTKPLGSLHALEHLACKMAGITRRPKPSHLKKSLLVLAADHGVKDPTTTSSKKAIAHFLSGGSIAAVLARHAKASPTVINMGITAGTNPITEKPAMSRQQVLAAINFGISLTKDELQKGTEIIGIGTISSNSLPSCLAILSIYTGLSIQELVADCPLQNIEAAVSAANGALSLHHVDASDPLAVLETLGGFEIAGLVGIIVAAAAGRSAVVLDGLTTLTAAVVAMKLAPMTRDYLVGSHFSIEPAIDTALHLLELPAYLRLNLNTGEGSGAALGMTMIDAGLHVLNDMKTFGEAQVAVAHDGPGSLKQRADVYDTADE